MSLFLSKSFDKLFSIDPKFLMIGNKMVPKLYTCVNIVLEDKYFFELSSF